MPVKWEDPPRRSTGETQRRWLAYNDAAAELKLSPQQWGVIEESLPVNLSASIAFRIRTGRYASFRPAGDWEAVSRNGSVYVRYIGGA